MQQFERVWRRAIAPLFAILVVALSASGGAAAATIELNGSLSQHHTTTLDAKPCQHIDAQRPAHKQCSGSMAFSPAARRSRTEQQEYGGIAPANPVANLLGEAPGTGAAVLPLRRPPRPGVRAPFWAVFAVTPQLRN